MYLFESNQLTILHMTNELLVWTCIQLGANFKDCFSKLVLKTMVVNEYVFSRVKWSV